MAVKLRLSRIGQHLPIIELWPLILEKLERGRPIEILGNILPY